MSSVMIQNQKKGYLPKQQNSERNLYSLSKQQLIHKQGTDLDLRTEAFINEEIGEEINEDFD